MKRIILFLLVFGFAGALPANNNDREKSGTKVICGKITDQSGEAVAGASLFIHETGETIFADMDGNFKITFQNNRDFHIVIHTLGFAPRQIESARLGTFCEISLDEL